MARVVRWIAVAEGGLEHLVLYEEASGVRADAVVIGGSPDEPYALRYTIVCDATWRVREIAVATVGDTPAIHLVSDARGHWTDPDSRPLPALESCLFVDLAATPFTNTLPIRALRLQPGESRDIPVVYLPAPSLAPFPVTQRYTRLAERRYRYEGYPAGFSADLEVDADGLVLDYPGLFRRLR